MYIKKMCVLREMRQGFSCDGTYVSGIVRLESYNGRLHAEITLINFAEIATGRYVAVLTDTLGNTVRKTCQSRGVRFASEEPFILESGFCVLVLFVRDTVTPVACAVYGENVYNTSEILKEAEKQERAGIPTGGYADDSVASDNYFLFGEKENERKLSQLADFKEPCPIGQAQAGPIHTDENENAETACDDGNPMSGRDGSGDSGRGGERSDKGSGDDGRNGIEGKANGSEEPKVVFDASVESLFKKAEEGQTYYESVRTEIEAMFATGERDARLEKMMPDSEWVRIPCGKNKFYAVGIMKTHGKVRYIFYGVPAKFTDPVKEKFKRWCSFVPVTPDSEGEGYRILCQDAETGACIRLSEV